MKSQIGLSIARLLDCSIAHEGKENSFHIKKFFVQNYMQI